MLLCAAALLPGAVRAQSTYSQPPFYNPTGSEQGLNVGRFVLFPSISFNYAHDDNFFYQSEELSPVATGRVEIVPRLMVDLPLSRSRVRFQYSPLYREYMNQEVADQQQSKWSHLFNFEASVLMADVFTVALRDHYVYGTQEVQEFDPGGEVRFNLVPFILHEPSAEFSLDAGVRHRFSFIPRWYSLDFDDSVEGFFYDSRRRGYEGRYTFKLSPETQIFASTIGDYTQQDRAEVYGDVDVDTRVTSLGLQRLAGGIITTGGSIGWEQMDFHGGFGSDYSGLAADINVGLNPSEIWRFNLMFRRNAYQSYFINNSHYINLEGRLRMIRQVGRTGFWQLGLTLAQNDYRDPVVIPPAVATPDPDDPNNPDRNNNGYSDVYEAFLPSQGLVRLDRAGSIDLSAGLRLRPTLRMLVGYNYQARDSNVVAQTTDPDGAGPLQPEFVESLDYTDNRVYVTLELGFL